MNSTAIIRLRRFVSRATDRSTCDLCRSELSDRHRHMIESAGKRMLCACDACALLFDDARAHHPRFRPIPREVTRLDLKLSDAEWAGLGIPIGLAFFTVREPAELPDLTPTDPGFSGADRHSSCGVAGEILQLPRMNSTESPVLAGYPSPAGPVMSSVDPEDWQALILAEPGVGKLRADVEALLINRTRTQRQAFIVPLDVCFQLIGIIRRHWQGWSGGPDVQREIEHYFEQLDRSAGKGRPS